VCLVFVAWFAVFGGEIFGPILEKRIDKAEFNNYLATCPFDEVRLEFYDVEGREIKMTFNFNTRNLSSLCNELVGPWRLFWTKKNPFTNTITSALAAPPIVDTDDILMEIKQALASLPEQDFPGSELNRDQACFAFWRDSQSRIYRCSKTEARTDHMRLINLLGLSSL
jgi:hypothetical protein